MKKLVMGAALALATAASGVSFAQSYPNKPLRWIVPTGPGSAVDVTARRVAPKLSELLGQPVIVENRPGANSMIGAREAARAGGDGYTLYQGVINNAINDALAPDPCCLLNERLIPVTRLLSTPLVLVVHPSMPANTVKEYVAIAKGKPGSLTYASGGAGSITQMLGELFKFTTQTNIREVPYKAIGAEFPDLVGGHVGAAYLAPVVIRDSVASGKIKALAVAAKERTGMMPNVPTMAEAGFPAVEGFGWNGLFVPAGTPQAIVQRLHAETAKVLQMDDMKADSVKLGYMLGGESPAEFAAFVKSETQRWAKVIKEVGIKAE